MSRESIKIYDCTLREGAQASEIAFSLQDKLKITHLFDEIGFAYTEGGWPSSNVKDQLYFEKLKNERLKQIKVVGFGRCKTAGVSAEDDVSLAGIVRAGLSCGHIFGKGWDFHVETVLRISREENLEAIFESIRFLKKHLEEVSFGFEHFFDAYKNNPDYSLQVIRTAVAAGIDWIDLADTNGGCFPGEIGAAVSSITKQFDIEFAVHCHNDTGCGVANTIAAVQNGAKIVEGTVNGYAERCGMADLCTVIPNLQLKLGYRCIPDENIRHLMKLSMDVAEIVQAAPLKFHPYVGSLAFTHKGGVHVDAFLKNPRSYEHIDPALVGNRSNVVLSEVSGKGNLKFFLRKHGLDHLFTDGDLRSLVGLIKRLELSGFEFNTVEESLLLLILKECGKFTPKIEIKSNSLSFVNESEGISRLDTVSIAFGAVMNFFTERGNHLDEDVTFLLEGEEASFAHLISRVIAKCAQFFPELAETVLLEYNVRAINDSHHHPQRIRVTLEFGDRGERWRMIGLGRNAASATMNATIEALEYRLNMDGIRQMSRPAPPVRRSLPPTGTVATIE